MRSHVIEGAKEVPETRSLAISGKKWEEMVYTRHEERYEEIRNRVNVGKRNPKKSYCEKFSR